MDDFDLSIGLSQNWQDELSARGFVYEGWGKIGQFAMNPFYYRWIHRNGSEIRLNAKQNVHWHIEVRACGVWCDFWLHRGWGSELGFILDGLSNYRKLPLCLNLGIDPIIEAWLCRKKKMWWRFR